MLWLVQKTQLKFIPSKVAANEGLSSNFFMKTKLKNLPRTFLRREVPKSQKTYCLKASAVKLNPYGEVTLFKKPKHLKVATFGEKFFKNQPQVPKPYCLKNQPLHIKSFESSFAILCCLKYFRSYLNHLINFI